jgi:hypothetical protein
LEPNANFAYLFLFARPVFTKESFFEPALSNGSNLQTILNELVEQVSSGNVFKRIFQPDFNPSRTWKYRAEALWAQMDYPTSEASEIPRYTLNLQIDFNGTGHLFCGKAADKYLKGPLLAYPELIAGLTVRFITYMAKLYEKARYVGLVDMGIALTGLKGCVANTNAHYLQYSSPPYDCDSYKKSGQFSAIQMLDDPLISSKYLVMSFIKAISQDRIDPFRQK